MENINGELNCGIKIRNDLLKADENQPYEISNMVKFEQVPIKVETTIPEIYVKEEKNEEFPLKDMPISLKENLTENIRKESVKSRKDMKKLEPGMINNHGIKCEPNYNINIKEEICETNHILLKDYRTETKSKDKDIYEQFLTKYKDTVDNFCIKKEITEELIIKNENDDEVILQEEQFNNNDVQLLIEDEYIPGCSFSTKKDSKSTIDAQNQKKFSKESRQMNNKQFKCNKCFETLNIGNEQEMHNHIQICQNKFEYSHSSDRHESTQNDEKPHKCGACKKTFSQKQSLKRHASIHTVEKPFACDICKTAFKRSYGLFVHKRIHTDERPFSCDKCKKAFKRANELKVHKLTHIDEKPCACDVCNKKFRTKDKLVIHKRIHTGEKPYTCVVCKKTFTQKIHLTKHAFVHTGEKRFACNVCSKTFIRKDYLNVHIRNHRCSRKTISM